MKVLVLNGSPKSISSTMIITKSFLSGLNSNNDCDINIVDVIEKNIKPCYGCFGCMEKKEGHCVKHNDDLNSILDEMLLSDVIIWSFPLYSYSLPSHLKAVLDRTLPFSIMAMKEVNGKFQHVRKFDFSQKKIVVICGCGFPNFKDNFEALRIQMNNCFHNHTMICISEAPMFLAKEADVVTKPLLDKIINAGRMFKDNMYIDEETIKQIETPMIPNDIYIKIVNGQNN